MGFIPISMADYIPKYLSANPGTAELDLRRRLSSALSAFKAGKRCACGNPMWVIGSAEAGHACFTCITTEATPDQDYELSEALNR